MGTLAWGQGDGGRRAVDCDVNLIPLVDLLVCSISFLLITAVWSHMSRIEGRASFGSGEAIAGPPVEKVLHVDMRGEKSFVLSWKVGPIVLTSSEVARKPVGVSGQDAIRFPDLAVEVEREWSARAVHRNAGDRAFDQAVVHASNSAPFEEVVAVLDAISKPKRSVDAKGESVTAFRIGFATD